MKRGHSLVEHASRDAHALARRHPRAASALGFFGQMALLGFGVGSGMFLAEKLLGRRGKAVVPTVVAAGEAPARLPSSSRAISTTRGMRFR